MNLLITGAWQQAKEYIPRIEKRHTVMYLQYEKEELHCNSDWVEGIIGNGFFLYHSIEDFKNLKYIQLTSAGFDRVPMDYVKEHNIKINNARGVYSIPMAEYALTGVLSLYKRTRFFSHNQGNHTWEKARDLRELYGKHVCILGCGSVGTECAIRFGAMGCNVYGVDPIVKEQTGFTRISNTDSIKDELSKADIVIITLPLTDSTRHMIDSSMLAMLKDDSVIVNIARGALIDTDSLLKELRTRRISAVLDVFEDEPLDEESALWSLDNVIITPHNSFVGEGNGRRLSNVIISNLEDL